jgi:hypothetical protein
MTQVVDAIANDGVTVDTANVTDALWKSSQAQMQAMAAKRNLSLMATPMNVGNSVQASQNVSTLAEAQAWIAGIVNTESSSSAAMDTSGALSSSPSAGFSTVEIVAMVAGAGVGLVALGLLLRGRL